LTGRRRSRVLLAVITLGALVLGAGVANADKVPPGQAKKATPSPSPTVSPAPTATTSPSVSPTVTASPTESPQPTATSSPTTTPSPTSPWTRTFTEDFSKDVAAGAFKADSYYSTKFKFYNEGTLDTSKNAVYDENRVLSVHDGALDAYLHTYADLARGFALVCGGWGGQLYGRFQVRFKSDPVAGYGEAFLLWPRTNIWSEGEIDWAEGALDGTIHGYVHEIGNPSHNLLAVDTGQRYDTWHVATIEWVPSEIRLLLDGKLVGKVDKSQGGVPQTMMRYTLQVGSNGAKPPVDSAGHLYIDWIAMDAYTP
jgi:Glycosyl hydrolases family 16